MQQHKKTKLYVLEKVWLYKPGIKMTQDNLHEVLIRPCSVSHRTYRAFSLGHSVKDASIVHGGSILSWFPNSLIAYSYSNQPIFKSFEEFMVYANVNRCVMPTIENWMILNDMHMSYFIKTIDLKTNEVLYDKTDEILKKFEDSSL